VTFNVNKIYQINTKTLESTDQIIRSEYNLLLEVLL